MILYYIWDAKPLMILSQFFARMTPLATRMPCEPRDMAQGYMEIGEPWLSIIVTVAGVLILSGWVQQLVKGYRTKSLKDISRYLLLLILAGATLWLIYGFAVGDVFIIGTNVAAIVLMLTVYIMKKRYDDERRWTENISSA